MRLKAPSWIYAVALVIPSGRPAIEIKGFHMVEGKETKKTVDMKAQRARLYKPEDVVALDSLEAQLWGKSKKPYQLHGLVGVLDSNTQDFQIFEKAEVLSPDGYRFKTTNCLYQKTKHQIVTEEAVEAEPISSKGPSQFKITGRGLRIDLDESTYEIKHNARTEQKVSEKNTLVIHGNSVVFEPDRDQATFLNAVTVKSPTMELKGERLKITFSTTPETESSTKEILHPKFLALDSPKSGRPKFIKANIGKLNLQSKGLEIELESDGSVLRSKALGSVDGVTEDNVKLKADTLVSDVYEGKDRILLDKNVEIVTDTRTAHCQGGQYFPDSGDVVLERLASVQTSDQLLEGELIRFNTRNSEITVEKAKGSVDRTSILKKSKP